MPYDLPTFLGMSSHNWFSLILVTYPQPKTIPVPQATRVGFQPLNRQHVMPGIAKTQDSTALFEVPSSFVHSKEERNTNASPYSMSHHPGIWGFICINSSKYPRILGLITIHSLQTIFDKISSIRGYLKISSNRGYPQISSIKDVISYILESRHHPLQPSM